MHLGIAFQLVDDVLDYSGDREAIGKSLGDDLAEGKMTLPLIRALAVGSDADAAIVRHAIGGGGIIDFQPVVDALERTGARSMRASVPSARARPPWHASRACPILRTAKLC